MFKQRNTRYIKLLRECPFTHKEIRTIYKQCYIPTVSYPLPATHIPPHLLYDAQSSATTVFLTKLGYPRTFPRSVVYASTSRGGTGFRHLGYEQGVQKCMQLVKQIRAGTSMGHISTIILAHYQLMAGLSQPVLEDTRRLPWSNSKWFDTVRQFLHSINGKIILQQPWLITRRRQHDRYLMDDVLALRLTNAQNIQVQSVRLFLRVSVLSELTNHCGTQLLPRALRRNRPTPNNPYTGSNYSRLLWPNQPAPSPSAWQTWNDVIRVLYLKPNSNDLSTPLGAWLPDYETDYNWIWRICPRSYILFHQHHGTWIAFPQRHRFDTHIRYQLSVSNTSVPEGTVPVTPILLSNSITVQLPIILVTPTPPGKHQPIPLATRLSTPDSEWVNNLWSEMRPHAHTDQLREAIIHNNRIILVSDAAVHNNGQATCAWVIWSGTMLWSGEGYIPGRYDDANSGQAKAYGVDAVIRFFSQYVRLYPIILQTKRVIQVYCDNQGVIERINNHNTILYPRDTIRDEYPIYADIHHHIRQLRPIQAEFNHVKGHQDNKPENELTTPERLNVDCDRRAAQVQLPCHDLQIQNNPMIAAAYPHVLIDDQVISRQLQHHLRDAATFPAYWEYLQTKFQWTNLNTTCIHWKVHQLANHHLTHSERRIINKFIHEWLPLLDRYHVLSNSQTKQCPSCRQAVETTDHFLNCSHPERQQIWNTLHDSIFKLHIQQHAPPQYYNVMANGLLAGRGAPTIQMDDEDDPMIQQIRHKQDQLGWKQIYYGRITSAWAHGITASQETIKGIVFYSRIILLIWKAVIEQWTIRNTHLHPTNSTQDDRTQLENIVYQIIQEAQADPALQDMVATVNPEVLLRRPIKHIRQWITNSKNHMIAHQKASAIQAQLKTRDIRTYFPVLSANTEPGTNEKNLLRPP